MNNLKKPAGVRKRAQNACVRCRQQKIKCLGRPPCEQCTKRNVACTFDDKAGKVLVTRRFISELEERIAALDNPTSRVSNLSTSPDDVVDDESAASSDGELSEEDDRAVEGLQGSDQATSPLYAQVVSIPPSPVSEPRLLNSLALGASTYVPGNRGVPVYLGPSSDWSFCRRVLSMTHESIFGAHLSPENLFFPDELYDLGWDGQRAVPPASSLGPGGLPSPDFAMYLVNTVKFHCGQLFHLFDEESFMERFAQFHDSAADKSALYPLWYIHYLLIIAFGKAFVSRSNRGKRPPGAELFTQAMRLLPDFTFSCPDPVQTSEILCCAALYLQSLDFRTSAYKLIGQALRIALEYGMHTGMESRHVPERFLQRCRKVWWTVYMLDRQMSSLMGLPLAIRDEDVSAGIPTFPGFPQKATALRLHIGFSRILAQIFNTVYGVEARQDQLFLNNTKIVLRSIADTTDQLNSSFNLQVAGAMAGISRTSAYLHLLHHQCIILATRPLLFRLLETKLNAEEAQSKQQSSTGNVRTLLQTCIDSAQQMLTILCALQEQDLLESFLPFDLSSVSNSAIVILMTTAIDPCLLDNHSPWSKQAYSLLDEMLSRGNLIAGFLKSELIQLDTNLSQLSTGTSLDNPGEAIPVSDQGFSSVDNGQSSISSYDLSAPSAANVGPSFPHLHREDLNWQEPFTTGQLMTLADSLDMNEMNWLSLPLFCGQG